MGSCFSTECNICSPDVNLNNITLDEIVDTCCPRGKIEILRTRMANLRELKMEVETEIKNNRTARMEVRKEVEGWIKDVGKLDEQVSPMVATYDAKDMSCCFICLKNNSDIRSKTRLVEEMIQQKANWKDPIFVPRPPTTAILAYMSTDIVGMEEVMWQLLEFLKHDKVRIIGIHGMGGAGKTTLAKQLVKILHSSNTPSGTATGGGEAPKFDVIIWAVVSQEQNTENLQKSIAKELNLHESSEFKDKDVDTRARFLSSYLSPRRFLLVLDDVWKKFDLGSIGIPALGSGKKIVLTTREEKVCTDMNARKSTVKVGCLGEEESWELFRKKIQWGEDEFKSIGIYEIAREMVGKCRGLPLALIAIARAMATKSDFHAWRYANEELTKSPHGVGGMERVYELLKFSYDNLKCEEYRSCLLYSTLFPEDEQIRIVEMVDLFISGENSCSNRTSSDDITYLRGKGRFIITELIDACLLERGEDEEHVKVHHAIRDMILWFREHNRGRRILSYAKKDLTGRFDVNVEEWGAASMVSFWDNGMEELRIEEEEDHRTSIAQCSGKVENIPRRSNNLQVLLLHLNRNMNVPRSLLRHFSNLRVLDLSSPFIREIPTSISSLEMLQYLNISMTRVEILPNEMSNLKNLMQLDLSLTIKLCKISDGVFSSLSKLQSLNLLYSSFFSNKNPHGTQKPQLQVLKELGHLRLLKDVRLYIEGNINALKFLVDGSDSLSNSITVLAIEEVDLLKDGLFKRMGSRLKKLEELYIFNFGNGEDLGIDGRHFPELNMLVIDGGGGIVELPSQLEGCVSNHHHEAILPKLKSIRLMNLPNFVRISSSQLQLHSLKEVSMDNCPSLKDISLVVSPHNVQIRCPRNQWEGLQWRNSRGVPPPNFILDIY